MKWTLLHKKVYDIIKSEPGIHVMEICRRINHKSVRDCRRAHKYAPHIKGGWTLRCKCPIKYAKVLRVVNELEKMGLIITRKEKKKDLDVARGWDIFRCCYPRH